MTNLPHAFSSRLRTAREQRRMSKTALAKAVGVSTTCVWNWEEGNTEPRSENLSALANILGMTAEFLESGNGLVCDLGEHGRGELGRPNLTLPEVIHGAKLQIASLAGIDPSKVKISLDY